MKKHIREVELFAERLAGSVDRYDPFVNENCLLTFILHEYQISL